MQMEKFFKYLLLSSIISESEMEIQVINLNFMKTK